MPDGEQCRRPFLGKEMSTKAALGVELSCPESPTRGVPQRAAACGSSATGEMLLERFPWAHRSSVGSPQGISSSSAQLTCSFRGRVMLPCRLLAGRARNQLQRVPHLLQPDLHVEAPAGGKRRSLAVCRSHSRQEQPQQSPLPEDRAWEGSQGPPSCSKEGQRGWVIFGGLHRIPGQPAPAPHHPLGEEFLPYI